MKYNSLSISLILIVSFFVLFFPVNTNAQSSNNEQQIDVCTTKLTRVIKIEECVNKYLEIKLINGKKVNGKLIECKNESLTVKNGLIKKQIPVANVNSFQIVPSPCEKFKEDMQKTKEFAISFALSAREVAVGFGLAKGD